MTFCSALIDIAAHTHCCSAYVSGGVEGGTVSSYVVTDGILNMGRDESKAEGLRSTTQTHALLFVEAKHVFMTFICDEN